MTVFNIDLSIDGIDTPIRVRNNRPVIAYAGKVTVRELEFESKEDLDGKELVIKLTKRSGPGND
jgi:hypothetical protein